MDIKNYKKVRNQFPRELTELEKELLFSILPEGKPGYKFYREKIPQLFVTGFGRFANGNMMLGAKDTVPDDSFPSMPVFASGTVEFEECIADINIHEIYENEIEFDIAFSTDELPDNLLEVKRWNYSDWNHGQKAPNDNSEVREIWIVEKEYLLAIAPAHKKIWVHHTISGVNNLIPVSNLYNYLMLLKNIREPKIVSKPALFFSDHDNYSDEDIVSAFLVYNKYFKKFKIDYSLFEKPEDKPAKKRLFKIFKRG